MNTHIFAPSHAHVRQFFWKIFRKRLMLFLKRQTCTSGLDKEGQCLRNKEKTKKSKIIKNTPSRNECFSVYFNYIMTVFSLSFFLLLSSWEFPCPSFFSTKKSLLFGFPVIWKLNRLSWLQYCESITNALSPFLHCKVRVTNLAACFMTRA